MFTHFVDPPYQILRFRSVTKDAHAISDWARKHSLVINVTKTIGMIFGSNRKLKLLDMAILPTVVDGVTSRSVHSIIFLGLLINNDISFSHGKIMCLTIRQSEKLIKIYIV